VKAVNIPNFGLCLDTFHIAGRVWADPTAISGKNADGPEALTNSLAKMVAKLDVNRIFYVQVGNAGFLDVPLSESHPLFVQGQLPTMTWSRNARLFAFEESKGGYLLVMDVLKAIVVDLGYRGWLSAESFNRDLSSK
jgi:4-hydroxyphenylpyruvate dioxygenase